MKFHQMIVGLIGLGALFLGTPLKAELLIEETFTGYQDNVLISANPAGSALGLTGDWTLIPNSDFYVNRTQADLTAGTGKAVYDRPSNDNGTRTATRGTSADHVLYEDDGDVFYASFLIHPARANGDMTFELDLTNLDGGGALDFAFGIIHGQYFVGNGGVDINIASGTVTANEQFVLVRIEYGAAESGPDANEVITLWVDPVDVLSTPVIDGALTDILSRGGGKIMAVAMRGDQMDGSPAFFDNLRVGLSFESVADLYADFDEDGDVDGADFLIWQRGESPNPLSTSDFDEWEKYFGTRSGSNASAPTAVPEPTSGIMLVLGVVVLLLCRHAIRE
ncbi:MAG: PEP-CTERM sorting domain-containing protein [Pirellulales bacterium]|nr:PEP-CTERM sorting domain-containing protein [Pirellulales bacterium]